MFHVLPYVFCNICTRLRFSDVVQIAGKPSVVDLFHNHPDSLYHPCRRPPAAYSDMGLVDIEGRVDIQLVVHTVGRTAI